MKDYDLRKLSRAQLLELLLAQSKEVARLQEELQQAQRQLEDRRIRLSEAGNIAEAALQISGVFSAAQAAAEEYLASVSESMAASQEKCRIMEEETREKCERMICAAQKESAAIWDDIREKLRDPYLEWESWKQVIDILHSKPGDQNKVRK